MSWDYIKIDANNSWEYDIPERCANCRFYLEDFTQGVHSKFCFLYDKKIPEHSAKIDKPDFCEATRVIVDEGGDLGEL